MIFRNYFNKKISFLIRMVIKLLQDQLNKKKHNPFLNYHQKSSSLIKFCVIDEECEISFNFKCCVIFY